MKLGRLVLFLFEYLQDIFVGLFGGIVQYVHRFISPYYNKCVAI
ncbi:hypothetical protein QA612_15430 [Evansella sp. AB-P1]|nr:hypothetical protein [Evansella sp. AB-P1]MDG5788863.1 hypothetical protein [Evansella sp. AB-P1]